MEVALLNVPPRSKQLNSERLIMYYDFRKSLHLIFYITHKTSTPEYIFRPPTVTKLKNVFMINNQIITIIIYSVIRKRCRGQSVVLSSSGDYESDKVETYFPVAARVARRDCGSRCRRGT